MTRGSGSGLRLRRKSDESLEMSGSLQALEPHGPLWCEAGAPGKLGALQGLGTSSLYEQ